MEKTDMLRYEKEWYSRGKENICGCDEAGAGPLAGPVYAAAVILPRDFIIDGVTDSKKISPRKREKLFEIICRTAVCWAVASVSADEIDRINILNARMKAMDEAIRKLRPNADFALIDGNCSRGICKDCKTIVHGDSLSESIAAASILAKVSRDRYMCEMAVRYPQYGFEKHKGYGTKQHYEAIRKYGPCPIHRRSFLKSYFEAAEE